MHTEKFPVGRGAAPSPAASPDAIWVAPLARCGQGRETFNPAAGCWMGCTAPQIWTSTSSRLSTSAGLPETNLALVKF